MTAQNGVNTKLTRPAMAVFERSAVVSPAFKKQFYKELLLWRIIIKTIEQ